MKPLFVIGAVSLIAIQIENFDKPYYLAVALLSAFVAVTTVLALKQMDKR